MPHNLYSLTEEELNNLCVQNLFDKKDTIILKSIIIDDMPIKEIAFNLGKGNGAIYKRINKIKEKLKIINWTDNLDKNI